MPHPSRAACNKAEKLLTRYDRLVERYGRKLPAARLAQLDAKRAAETISSDDLPATLKAEFPGELAGWTLGAIRRVAERRES